MNKLLGVLLIAATACASAAAQQENDKSSVAASSAMRASLLAQTDQAVPLKPVFKLVIEFPQTTASTEGQRRFELPRQGSVLLPQWVLKDGAFYIDVLGKGTLIPVPGGGATGCFDQNLRERIEKLKTIIESFPPRPQPATPPRQ